MKKKVRILKVSNGSFVIAIILTILFFIMAGYGDKEFHIFKQTTNQYIVCEEAAKKLQDASNYLTEQVRLYVMTGNPKYMHLYLKEVNKTKRGEIALQELKKYFDKTAVFVSIQDALNCSNQLMNTEYYTMRLVAEADGISQNKWPDEIKKVSITDKDEALSAQQKREKAQRLVCGNDYQERRNQIVNEVVRCTQNLICQTKNRQGRATTIFSDIYLKLQISTSILVILMIILCVLVRKLIVIPLMQYNESIKQGKIFPVVGA